MWWALSDLVRDIKAGSSGFIKRKRWVAGRLAGQEGNLYEMRIGIST